LRGGSAGLVYKAGSVLDCFTLRVRNDDFRDDSWPPIGGGILRAGLLRKADSRLDCFANARNDDFRDDSRTRNGDFPDASLTRKDALTGDSQPPVGSIIITNCSLLIAHSFNGLLPRDG
jgi:hypothetical protein